MTFHITFPSTPNSNTTTATRYTCTIVCQQSKDVSYMNAKERSDVDPEVTYNHKFKQPINYTVSSVHIPVEIYKGGTLFFIF